MAERNTILIVDDQAENLVALGELLQENYRVKVADSGERALRIAAASPKPDLILLDVLMPGLDGYTVLRRLREDPHTADIPVIFVTARDAPEDEEMGLALGAVDYVTKPVRPLVVLARVRAHLENKLARDFLRDQNRFLEAEVARRIRDNELTQNMTMHALALLAEARDSNTGGHIRRTQMYVDLLGRHLLEHTAHGRTLTPLCIDLMVRAAPLHDIGKVAMPDDILKKASALTPDEFAVIRTHSRIGGDAIAAAMFRVEHADAGTEVPPPPALEPSAVICFSGVLEALGRDCDTPLRLLEMARQIAYWHHERWDGAGYPDGLSRESIPLSARIMALADVFDALVSERVYKPAQPFATARSAILAERGGQFDPEVVDAFVAQQDRFAEIAARQGAPEKPATGGCAP